MTRSTALYASVIAMVTLLLSGCMSLTGEITYDHQARGDGEVSVSVNKAMASMMGISSLDAFESALSESADEEGGLSVAASGEVTFSESDTDFIATVAFTQATFSDDDWRAVINADGNLDFTFVNEGMDDGDFLGDADLGRIDLTINFPGEVLEYGGEGATKVDADTVRWQVPLTTTTTLTATSTVPAPATMPVGLLLAVGGAALLAVAGLIVVNRRRRSAPAGTDVAEAPEAEFLDAADAGSHW